MIHRNQPQTINANDSPCTVRRFTGPEADELFVLCRPDPGAVGVAAQTESVYGRCMLRCGRRAVTCGRSCTKRSSFATFWKTG